jgi:hypothetical protein
VSLSQKLDDVLIVERVKDEPPGPARLDETHAPQEAKLVGDGGFADYSKAGDVTNAELAAAERIEDPDPRGISKDTEGIGNVPYGIRRHQPSSAGFGSPRVEMRGVAELFNGRNAGHIGLVEVQHLNI